MWQLFEENSGDKLWSRVVDALKGEVGVIEQPSRAGSTRELLHAALTLRNPRARWVTLRRPAMNPAFALAEVFWILSGRRDAQFVRYFNRSLSRHAGYSDQFHGAYGYRLRKHFDVDQLTGAFQALHANPNSRQVILQIWDPRIDLPDIDGRPRDPDIPCNTQSLLKIRSGKLEWVQIMRSNDVFRGLPHNLVQFTMLHEIVSGWLGVGLGEYHHVSDSLHIYSHDDTFADPKGTELDKFEDNFAISWPESVRAIEAIVKIVERIIDDSVPAGTVEHLTSQVVLPEAYQNSVYILAAEGIRRRGESERASNLVANKCTSPVLSRLWKNWCNRLLSGSSPT